MNDIELARSRQLQEQKEQMLTLETSDLPKELQEEDNIVLAESELSYYIEPYYIELTRLRDNLDIMSKKCYEQTTKILVKGLQRQYKYNYRMYREHSSYHIMARICSKIKSFFRWTILLPITLTILICKSIKHRKRKKQAKRDVKEKQRVSKANE